MKLLRQIVAALLLLAPFTANAGIIISIEESGKDLVASYSGTIDLGATQSHLGDAAGYNGFMGSYAAVSFTTGISDIYVVNLPSWTPFGNSSFVNWSSSSGDALHLFYNPLLGLADGYMSGDVISGHATLRGASFTDYGMTRGTYVSVFSNGGIEDFVTVNIGSAPVPEPGTLALLGLGIEDSITANIGSTPVPEPGTLALLGLGLAGMGMTRRTKKV